MAESAQSPFRMRPFQTVDNVRRKVVEAVLSQSSISHPGLLAELRRRLSSTDVDLGALVREPVIESAAPFISDPRSFSDLSGGLLHPSVIDAVSNGEKYRFPADAKPYKHQIEAWELLTKPKPQSVLVSSGTGSGKTECFMLPLLHDLAQEAEAGRLSGVRALALYPLNALIASQEERLSEWTKPYEGRIRFGLYNGLTPEKVQSIEAQKYPEQALDRYTLRKDPPPILVTNITMLEYLTVRKIDRPLIENSRSKLRWIILDEAHSYAGSSAAEVALLIRRVLHTFSVRPTDVRFVATSATIGEGRDVTLELRRFLSDISGVGGDQVHVVMGERQAITLPSPATEITLSAEDLQSDSILRSNSAVQNFVKRAAQPLSYQSAHSILRPTGCQIEDVISAIATDIDGQGPILPLRVHSFMRAVPGMWSCINPSCSGRPLGKENSETAWPFGALQPYYADTCTYCQSPVVELVNCNNCGAPYLEAIECDGKLQSTKTINDEDEFAAASENDTEGEGDEEDESAQRVTPPTHDSYAERYWLIATEALNGTRILCVNPSTGCVMDRGDDTTVAFYVTRREGHEHCMACGSTAKTSDPKGRLIRAFRFGAPFLIGNAAPSILEGVPPTIPARQPAHRLPAQGRQLLSFTDSRQGTARFAASLQTSAERALVRGFIYNTVQEDLKPDISKAGEIREKQAVVVELKPHAMKPGPLQDLYNATLVEIAEFERPSGRGISWPKLRSKLSQDEQVSHWMRKVWTSDRDKRFTDSEEEFAEFLLLREFARRPKRANAMETLGLARLRFAVIDDLNDTKIPDAFSSKGKNLDDWRQFLYLLLDTPVRSYFAIRINPANVRWLIRKGRNRTIIGPRDTKTAQSEVAWPFAGTANLGTSNAVLLLERGLRLDRHNLQDRADINDVLSLAWSQLRPLFVKSSEYALSLDMAHIAPVTSAWLCPVTRRFLNATAFGLSPYGIRENSLHAEKPAMSFELPRHPDPFLRDGNHSKEKVLTWLENDPAVVHLRKLGMWGDLHDTYAQLSPYRRSAEHSAQQPANVLRRYEREFKDGEINILNCSTTMEMGVDIGTVSAVMMTNVPPSIANYRQRVGRAGRRKQGFALSLTFTRDTPLDREAFAKPEQYLGREMAAPCVLLTSRPIVSRHVNAMLLASWFGQAGGEANKTGTGDFFGCPCTIGEPKVDDCPASQFRHWLELPSTRSVMREPVEQLIHGTVLEGDSGLLTATSQIFERVQSAFVGEWEIIQALASGLDANEIRGSLSFQLRRLCQENLLKDLSMRAVLPGHGFPNAVVPFINRTDKPALANEGDGDRSRRHSYPSRNRDIAIRDYAPGAQVVVDGLVYESAGVTLNWKRPAGIENVRDVQSLKWFWECRQCHAVGAEPNRLASCPECGNTLESEAIRHFLEPAGFTVDPAAQPHADTDSVQFIVPELERVVARDASWLPFAEPSLGRMRQSAEGMVYYLSSGSTGNQYALCLECGRAASIIHEGVNPLENHYPLAFTKKSRDGNCPGNSQPFAIQRPISLGHEVQTDVAELQPATLDDEGAAWALIVALRAALSKRLGVDPREMGMSVVKRKNAIGGSTHSLFLFDRNAGGAGFSPKLIDEFETLLADASKILDCQNKGCMTGCSACVLTSDLHDAQRKVNRTAALNFVTDQLLFLSKPTDSDRVHPDATYCRDLAAALIRSFNLDGKHAAIWCGGDNDFTPLEGEPFISIFAAAKLRGCKLSIVIPNDVLCGLDDAQKLGLRDTVKRWDLRLATGNPPSFPNGAHVLAASKSHTVTRLWATRDQEASLVGDSWGIGRAHPVVSFESSPIDWGAEVDLASMLPASGVAFVEIERELDRPLMQFGKAFADRLKSDLQSQLASNHTPLTAVEYSDRYVVSPLSALLVFSALDGIKKMWGTANDVVVPLKIETRALPIYDIGYPSKIAHNWRNDNDRIDVIKGMAKKYGFDIDIKIGQTAHSRELRLFFGNQTVRILLDQGFGFWTAPDFARFDFRCSPISQVANLVKTNFLLGSRNKTHIVITK